MTRSQSYAEQIGDKIGDAVGHLTWWGMCCVPLLQSGVIYNSETKLAYAATWWSWFGFVFGEEIVPLPASVAAKFKVGATDE